MKKIALFLLGFLSIILLSACGFPTSKEMGDRTVYKASDFIENSYEDATLKKVNDYQKVATPEKAFTIKEIIRDDTQHVGISVVKVNFFIPTNTYKPNNEEVQDYENWNLSLYCFEGEGSKIEEVKSVNFRLDDKYKTTQNGVNGYMIEVSFWGLEIGTYDNPKYPGEKCDRIIWEMYTDRFFLRLKPEQGSKLKTKTDWEKQENNPYNVCKFTISSIEITTNDNDDENRRGSTADKYKHDLSEVKTYGTWQSND